MSIGGQSAVSADKAPIEFDDKSNQILTFIADNGSTTSAALANNMGLSQRRVREILNILVAEGMVVKVGDYRNAKYKLKNTGCK